MGIADLLTQVVFQSWEEPFVAVDPKTRFAIVAGPNGPERVDSAFRRVLVPLHDWRARGVDPNEEVIKMLVEGSAMNPLSVGTAAVLDDHFWVKNRGWKAVLCNPGLHGRFIRPDHLLVVASDHVRPEQLVFVGDGGGFLVRQGLRQGAVTNRAQGLMQMQFSVPP